MIQTKNLTKKFNEILAVDRITLEIKEGQVFGLIGTNGAGKSTLMRMMVGIIQPDSGTVTIDELPVYNNPMAKVHFFYISDEQFFFPNAKPYDLCQYYQAIYPHFDTIKFNTYLEKFNLPIQRKIKTFSKGMKKQLSILLAISSNTKYILCDETFDGLDPVMRQGVKSIFSMEMEERGLTPIIASHNLREIEAICDQIGLMHQGGILLSNHLDHMKLSMFKLQCIFEEVPNLKGLHIITMENRNSLYTITLRGELEEITRTIQDLKPTFYELLPLTLEEIFLIETEAQGYDIKQLLQ